MKLVVYFHGTDPATYMNQVKRIQKAQPQSLVMSFLVDQNSFVSVESIFDSISFAKINSLYSITEIVFVGTSLGAWWASKLSDIFSSKCVLINPCYNPITFLKKFNISEDILKQYHVMSLDDLDRKEFVFSEIDNIIDSSELRTVLYTIGFPYDTFQNTDHQFAGMEFDYVSSNIV